MNFEGNDTHHIASTLSCLASYGKQYHYQISKPNKHKL